MYEENENLLTKYFENFEDKKEELRSACRTINSIAIDLKISDVDDIFEYLWKDMINEHEEFINSLVK